MQNSDIITAEAQADTLNKITKAQEMTLETCIERLRALIDSKKINESNLRELSNIWKEIDALREVFYIRLFNALKRGSMIVG